MATLSGSRRAEPRLRSGSAARRRRKPATADPSLRAEEAALAATAAR